MGWIRLHHTTLDSEVFHDPALWKLFTWCMLKANYGTTTWRGQPINRGQFVTGRNTAAEELGISPSTFYRGMLKLTELGCISYEANSNWTTITVCKYETYQSAPSERRTGDDTSDDTSDDTTDGQPVIQQVDTVLESKNLRIQEKSEELLPPKPKSSSSGDLLAAQEFVRHWNLTPGVRLCRAVTAKRVKQFATRIRDPVWDWRAALGKFPLKCFADGRWVPDLDWFLRPDTVLNIAEGKYDWTKNNSIDHADPRGNFAAARQYAEQFGEVEENAL